MAGEWERRKFGDLCLEKAQGPGISGALYDRKGNVAILRTTDIKADGSIRLSEMARARVNLERLGSHVLKVGDLVISRSGRVGATALFEGFEIPVIPAGYSTRFRLRDNADPKFYRYYFNSSEGQTALHSRAVGSVLQNLAGTAILEMEVPVPPLSEQRGIVRLLSTVQYAIRATEAVTAASRDLRHSLMAVRLRGGPLGLRGNSRVTMISTSLGSLPSDWQISTIGELFDIQQGKALSPGARSGTSSRPFLRTANVRWGYLDLSEVDQMCFTEHEATRYRLKAGDLLVCEGGEIGRSSLWDDSIEPCYYQNHLHRLRAKDDKVVPQFYMYWMEGALTLFGLYAGHGNVTTIPNLSKGRLASLQVPVPPRKQQLHIVNDIASVEKRIQCERSRARTLGQLYDSLLQKLMSGQLRLTTREAMVHA